jgi:signal transduction histidine kinase
MMLIKTIFKYKYSDKNMNDSIPNSNDELKRLLHLSDFDLDYYNIDADLKDLSVLAANIAGTEVSMINLLDQYTQWSVSSHNLEIKQMPREESVCQFTIYSEDHFEVKDLTEDHRFKGKSYVKEDPYLKYYLGVPLKTEEGINIGALCVLDKEIKNLTPVQIQSLQIVSQQIIFRLKSFKEMGELKSKVSGTSERFRKMAHDIRGPIGGIMGLAEMICMKGMNNDLKQVIEDICLIQKSCESLLEVSKDILENKPKDLMEYEAKFLDPNRQFNLLTLKEKLLNMYLPQALSKQIELMVNIPDKNQKILFSKSKLLQISGNLISNAIKFTPHLGKVLVNITLNLLPDVNSALLEFKVEDSGPGLSAEIYYSIHEGKSLTELGSEGEKGYGYGLVFTQALINEMKGKLQIETSKLGGASFIATLPVVTQKRSVIA